MKSTNTKWVLGHKVTTYETTGDYDLMMAETPARVPGPPPHSHNSFKESFLIIEGEMEFMVNGDTLIARAGESVDIPPRTVHTFANKSDKPCKWVNIHSPKGFRNFFEEMGISEHEENAVDKSLAPEIINRECVAVCKLSKRLQIAIADCYGVELHDCKASARMASMPLRRLIAHERRYTTLFMAICGRAQL